MSSTACLSPQPGKSGLQALYTLNKIAKRLAQKAESHTHNLQSYLKTTDCERSIRLRKEALYAAKKQILENIHTNANRIEIHTIRGEKYYCFYFGSWSFHSPVDEFEANVTVDGHIQLPDFDSSSAATRSQMTESEAVAIIYEEFGINLNELLPKRHIVTPDGTFRDIGWNSIEAPED